MPGENSHSNWDELRKGNADALLGLYREHYVGLMNYGLKLTGDHQLVKDCITNMLLNLHRKHKQLPGVSNLRSYLLTCLRNEIMSNARQQQRMDEIERSAAGEDRELPYEEYLVNLQTEQQDKERLTRALSTLSPREKELLCKRFFEDCSYDEIAGACGITKRTAYNIINAALKRLKAEMLLQTGNKMIYIALMNVLSAGIIE